MVFFFCPYIVIIDRCNWSFFAHFNVDFESSYWFIHTIVNANKSSSSFLTHSLSMSSLKCKVLCIEINFLVVWSFEFFPYPFYGWSRITYAEYCPGFFSFWEGLCCWACFWEVFLFLKYFFLVFFLISSLLVWWCIIIVITIFSFERFSYQGQLIVFHWSFSNRKSLRVFRMLLSVLIDLNNAGFYLSSYFQSFYQSFGDYSKWTNCR